MVSQYGLDAILHHGCGTYREQKSILDQYLEASLWIALSAKAKWEELARAYPSPYSWGKYNYHKAEVAAIRNLIRLSRNALKRICRYERAKQQAGVSR
jgi:hypothetical protein